MAILIPSLLFISGGIAGGWLFRKQFRRKIDQIQDESVVILHQGRLEAEKNTHQANLERASFHAQRQAELKQEFEQELDELKDSEKAIEARELLQETRNIEIDNGYDSLKNQRLATKNTTEQAAQIDNKIVDCAAQKTTLLENRSGLLVESAKKDFIDREMAQTSLRHQRWLNNHSQQAQKYAPSAGRRIMSTAIHRYNGVGHLERIQNTIALANAGVFSNWADPDGRAQKALLREVDCLLEAKEEQISLHVRGDNPLAREIARRALRQIANRSITNPDKIRTIARQSREEVHREVQNAGRKAIKTLQIGRVHPEILELVGRLKFRLSYSQNQLKHAIEVGYLAGMIAQELGLDIRQARRGGLLHDIGKAMTHDHEGSHAVLGAEVARRCGEEEIIANAIGSHHHDEPMETPIAHIVTAADAISGEGGRAVARGRAAVVGQRRAAVRRAAGFLAA